MIIDTQTRMRILALALAVFTVPAAHAEQADFVTGEDVQKTMEDKEKAEAQPDGWQYKLSLGFNAAFTNNSNVVGSLDGTSLQIGGIVEGEANLIHGQHEWANRLALAHQQSLTPALDEFIKTTDNLELRTMYLYSLEAVPWLGPFARARMQTQILDGELIRSDEVRVRKPGEAATAADDLEVVSAQEAYLLTDPFEPLLLRQSAGFFARPLTSKTIKLTATLGAGAQELIADGFAVSGDDETATLDSGEEVTVVPLSKIDSVAQVGVELEVEATGALSEIVTYTAFGNVLMPFYTSKDIAGADGDKLEGIGLLNTELGGKLSVKLASWVSVDYVLSAKRIPIIVDAWQVQNQLLLSSAFNLL